MNYGKTQVVLCEDENDLGIESGFDGRAENARAADLKG